MKKIVYFLMILFLNSISILNAQNPEIISGQYIVTLKESVAKPTPNTSTVRDEVQAAGANNLRLQNLSKVKSVYDKGGIAKAKITEEFSDATVGFSAKLSADEVEKIKRDPNVEGVYPDYKVSLSAASTEPSAGIAAGQTIPCAKESIPPNRASESCPWIVRGPVCPGWTSPDQGRQRLRVRLARSRVCPTFVRQQAKTRAR